MAKDPDPKVLLGAALDVIAADLTTVQQEALVASWERAGRLGLKSVQVVAKSLQTTTALVKARLAWEAGDTLYQAELTDLGIAVAQRLATRA